jgi:hypothetical protein
LFRFRKKKKETVRKTEKEKKKNKKPYVGRPIGGSDACGTEIAPAAGGS